ncbi:helix-turn-helix- domain containing protein, AraC type [Alkaliphilus metalliredigens QYMF]|uniref:Helix-turn-helix-domain containing protein, AraC type n=1 Tax=Alkaliphilus metalliredigens (strain QYMF) TaxID=293826 RepID=A6TPF7_ALKMQ|nr:helix-turn-helix transcriptional regulator [Alkaliphilus metalliredigens]ABR48075.1 helix-turn-helix- domain containing protein, AraC type [Alkaliphilus metalliredigens QYMF]
MYTEKVPEVEASLQYIQDNIFDSLSLDEIAHKVGYSPYHFTRIFKAHMGIPLFYYISSLRLQKAKDLLLHTDLTIRDIALEVGQQSLGTFTTRFTQKVGVSPAVFRRTATDAGKALQTLKLLDDRHLDNTSSGGQCSIFGNIETEIPYQGVVLIGLFPKPIPEGVPLYGTLVSLPSGFCLSGVRPGTYYLMATSVSWEMQAESILLTQKTLRTRFHKPLMISPGTVIPHLNVKLHQPQLDDPPILVSLPLLMKRFLGQIHQKSNP